MENYEIMKLFLIAFLLLPLSVHTKEKCNVIEDGSCILYGQEAIDAVIPIKTESGTLYGQESIDFRKQIIGELFTAIEFSVYDCDDILINKQRIDNSRLTPFRRIYQDIHMRVNDISIIFLSRVTAILPNDKFHMEFLLYGYSLDGKTGELQTSVNMETGTPIELGGHCSDNTTYDEQGNIVESEKTGYTYKVQLIE